MDLMAIAFPFNDPVAVKLGPLAIRWYGLAYLAGLTFGWLYMRRLCTDVKLWGGSAPMKPEQTDDFLFWATIGTVLGGGLGFFLFYEPSILFLAARCNFSASGKAAWLFTAVFSAWGLRSCCLRGATPSPCAR